MKHYFDEILRDGVLALEACKEPERYMIKLWVHLYTMDEDINAELCTDTDVCVEIEDVPVFLITFIGAYLHLKPIGREGSGMQGWYNMWSQDDRFHKILGCVFMQLKFTGDVVHYKLDP